MLISDKDICKSNPPFLLQSATNEWTLISKISGSKHNLKLEIVERKNEEFSQRSLVLNDPPFYVGADVWELEYGSRLMTLNHPSLINHPAREIWKDWLVHLNRIKMIE